jgi:hypothetical protein
MMKTKQQATQYYNTVLMALGVQYYRVDRLKAIVHILFTAAIQACRYLLYSPPSL